MSAEAQRLPLVKIIGHHENGSPKPGTHPRGCVGVLP
jgi:hypothetical protein